MIGKPKLKAIDVISMMCGILTVLVAFTVYVQLVKPVKVNLQSYVPSDATDVKDIGNHWVEFTYKNELCIYRRNN